MESPVKFETTKLKLGESARQRVHCGLRWNTADEGLSSADLDLVCFLYDKYGVLIEEIAGMGQRIDSSGNVYHTGDDMSGQDERDDERLSFDLFNMAGRVGHIFLGVRIKSDHVFAGIVGPSIRIADGLSDKDMVAAEIDIKEGGERNAYIFGRLHQIGEGGWAFQYLADYLTHDEHTDWAGLLAAYIPRDEIEAEPEGGFGRTPLKGQTVPLHVTQQARQRVLYGLRWDPGMEGGKTTGTMGLWRKKAPAAVDLDAVCVLFDAAGECVDTVSAKPQEAVDSSGAVYHSGDDPSGTGDNDDEHISVELLNLPDHISDVIFLAIVQSGHSFAEVRNPSARIADGMTDRNQLVLPLSGGADSDVAVLARIHRGGESGWTLHHIGEFLHLGQIEDWISSLQPYLKSGNR